MSLKEDIKELLKLPVTSLLIGFVAGSFFFAHLQSRIFTKMQESGIALCVPSTEESDQK